jgi:dynein heavy chain
MNEVHKNPVIKMCCHAPNRLQDLEALSLGLEKCQKSLNDYLDSKRNAFPRFFFISDDELLSILGSSDPACVQEHMIKVSTQRSYYCQHSQKWKGKNYLITCCFM